jgi:hypothetical protein
MLQWLKMMIIIGVFGVVVIAGLEASNTGVQHMMETTATSSPDYELPLIQRVAQQCSEWLQNVARTMMRGVVMLLD